MKVIWKIFGTYLLILFFILIYSNAFSQTKFCEQKICVVEFNADWNKANSVDWLDDLKDCGVTRINIDENKITQQQKEDFGIIVVPTIIVFNGKEVKRFQACLRFKMGATRKEVQAIIDETIMDKL
jgi:hypothetical protein